MCVVFYFLVLLELSFSTLPGKYLPRGYLRMCLHIFQYSLIKTDNGSFQPKQSYGPQIRPTSQHICQDLLQDHLTFPSCTVAGLTHSTRISSAWFSDAIFNISISLDVPGSKWFTCKRSFGLEGLLLYSVTVRDTEIMVQRQPVHKSMIHSGW